MKRSCKRLHFLDVSISALFRQVAAAAGEINHGAFIKWGGLSGASTSSKRLTRELRRTGSVCDLRQRRPRKFWDFIAAPPGKTFDKHWDGNKASRIHQDRHRGGRATLLCFVFIYFRKGQRREKNKTQRLINEVKEKRRQEHNGKE